MDEATRPANDRQDYAEQNNFRSYGEAKMTPEQERGNHLVGCITELKCAQFFGLKFDPSVGVITNVDCKILEVRGRRIESGRDLAIRPHDKMRLPHVLMWVDGKFTRATVVGWLCGWQGHQRAMAAKAEAGGHDVMWQQSKGVWFIPPPYHSIVSLQDWIGAGAPLHWAPEEYRADAS
jgi:hypothetical protein